MLDAEVVRRLSGEFGIEGGLVGVPYRMVYRFEEPDPQSRTYLRRLLQQELLKRGVVTFRGFMLPRLAHGEPALEQALAAFHGAFSRVRQVAERGAFRDSLEIPLIV